MTKYLVLTSILLFLHTGETRAPVPAKSQNMDVKITAGSHMDQNLKNYAKKNKFKRVSDSTYVHVGEQEDHSWDAKLNTNTGQLDVVIDYVNL